VLKEFCTSICAVRNLKGEENGDEKISTRLSTISAGI
jgi:hypothetical protein